MAFTFDPTTDRGRVRLLIGDSEAAYEIFADASIDAFLALENSYVKLAAALALDSIAASQALIQRVTQVGDIKTDGGKVADALRAQAQALRDSLANEIAFDTAQQGLTIFNWREIIWNDAQRQG